MSNLHRLAQSLERPRTARRRRGFRVAAAIVVLAVVAVLVAAFIKFRPPSGRTGAGPAAAAVPTSAQAGDTGPAEEAMEINRAVMVTVELDFGPRVPGIAEALQAIERRHEPDDRQGRVFAVLDAYGEPTADGKKLHLSMHLSTEKPGRGSLVFRNTGEVLWQSRVVQGTNTTLFTGHHLTILIDDGTGRAFMIDGSGNPASILDARLRDTGQTVREFWPDRAEREVTFIYSACGCPVKVMARRAGERTARTGELPVMFPDDPPVMRVIAALMGW
ncbi:MAG: hypothetical protein JXQ71_09190 [Verrucomicrobia bacterium]|nr:hypothetical protein [Verrucomicrobiota bacterium]